MSLVSYLYAEDTRSNEVLTELLKRGIVIPQPEAIRQYLLQHTDMIDLLGQVSKTVADRFHTSAQIALEMYRDLETDEVYPTLYIRQAHYDDTLLEQVNAVSALFDQTLMAKSGWLLITTDFASPQ